jgi:hypothetical protein
MVRGTFWSPSASRRASITASSLESALSIWSAYGVRLFFLLWQLPSLSELRATSLPASPLTESACALVVGLYTYLVLRDIIGRMRAAVGASFVVSLAWFVTYTHRNFYSEPFWLGATAGLLYHLSVGLRARRPWHFAVAGVWLGLMMADRPAETSALAVLPTGLLLGWTYRAGGISTSDLGILLLQVVAAAGAAALRLGEASELWVLLFLLVATVIAAFRARRFFVDAPVLGFLIVAVAISVVWHLPTMRMLYDWAYQSSFGQWAELSDQRFVGLSPIAVTSALLQSYSPSLLAIMAALAMTAFVGWPRMSVDRRVGRPLIIICVAILAVIPILILHMMSGTGDERRVMPSIFLLYIGLTALALLPQSFLARARLFAVAILAALQVTSAVATAFHIDSHTLDRFQGYAGSLEKPDTLPDSNIAVLEGLVAVGVREGFVIAYTNCLLGYISCSSHKMPFFEHVAVSTLALERGLPIYMHYFADLDLSKPDTLADQIRARGAQYILVDLFDDSDFSEVSHKHSFFQRTAAFIEFAKGTFPPGFTKVGCFATLRRPMCVYAVNQVQ